MLIGNCFHIKFCHIFKGDIKNDAKLILTEHLLNFVVCKGNL